jgi:ketosteroid isomerase-like protein
VSEENVEIVRRAIAAFNETNMLVGSGDPLPWLREFCDADLELDLSRRWIDPDIYRGYEGLLRFRAQYSDAWESARFDIEEVIDAGDRVVLFTHNTGVARSGVRLGVRVGHILTVKARKIVRWQYFGEDHSACLKAVGLEE